jgi:PIN domain nuclease of toxin-antitoxin system
MMLDPDNAVAVSVASIWEFAIKLSLGRIDYAGGVEDFGTEIVSVGFDIIPIAREHAEGVARLPPIHNDPFDRIIVATAIAEDMTLLSADDNIRKYAVKLGW